MKKNTAKKKTEADLLDNLEPPAPPPATAGAPFNAKVERMVRIKPDSLRVRHAIREVGIFEKGTWYRVPVALARALSVVRLRDDGGPGADKGPLVFEVCRTQEDAAELDQVRRADRRRRAAELSSRTGKRPLKDAANLPGGAFHPVTPR